MYETGSASDGKRVLILNSYTLTGRRAADQVRVRAFLAGLAEGGYRPGENLELSLLDSNDFGELESQLAESLASSPPDVIHAVGTPNAILALRRARTVPVVYYGAHPEGVGAVECACDTVRGVKLTLPFTSSYKSYRFVRKLLPGVIRTYVPFYEGTVFCPEAMREKHRRYRREHPGSSWIPGESDQIGYRSLAGLNYIVGLEYRELVYRDGADLATALEQVDPRQGMLMAYNDSVYCREAPRMLARFAAGAGMPLLWNNNPEATQLGALAAIAGCFKEAGRICGLQAARILDTGSTAGVETQTSSRTYASLNLRRASALGLELSDEVLSFFDERLESPSAAA